LQDWNVCRYRSALTHWDWSQVYLWRSNPFGQIWARVFGSLGTGWLATLNLVPIENPAFTAFLNSLLLWIPHLVSGIMIAWIFGKWKAIKEGSPFILVISLIQGGRQALVALFNPVLSAFLPSIVALVAVAPTLSIAVFLTMSQVLAHSGQIVVLALGIAAVAPPIVYVDFSNWIGVLGAFMTSSSTSSNILFAPLQAGVVQGIEGVSVAEVVAAQSVGAQLVTPFHQRILCWEQALQMYQRIEL